jgi:type IV secretory pathway VirB2 component (pilin)
MSCSHLKKLATNVTPGILPVALILITSAAQAQVVGGGTDPTTILTAIATYILGPFGQALAVLGCIAIGCAFLFGHLGLRGLGAFVGGLALVFGSAFLVQQFLGGAA